MKLDKLFNVLVLGGAALGVAACGSDGDDTDKRDDPANTGDDDGEEATDDNGGDDRSGDGSDMSADGSGADGQTEDDTSEDDGSDDDGTPLNDASVAVDQDAGGATLICSESPSPGDPCGCPCCWSGGLNTDDSCMGFCEAGNNGKGCCDV